MSLVTIQDFEAAMLRIEKKFDEMDDSQLKELEIALASRLPLMPAYHAQALRERLDKLRRPMTFSIPNLTPITLKKFMEEKVSDEIDTLSSRPIIEEVEETETTVRLINLTSRTLAVNHRTDSIYLSNCWQCGLSIGPCSGAATLENVGCSSVALAAHQIRLYKCKDLNICVFTPTAIVMEESENVQVRLLGRSEWWYETFEKDLKLASLADREPITDIIDFSADVLLPKDKLGTI